MPRDDRMTKCYNIRVKGQWVNGTRADWLRVEQSDRQPMARLISLSLFVLSYRMNRKSYQDRVKSLLYISILQK